MSKKFSIVWIVLLLYVIGYFAICIISGKQDFLWLELDFFSLIVSVVILAKHHFPKRKYMVISIGLTALYLMSEVFRYNGFTVISGIILFLSCCASCSVFEKYKENSLHLIRNKKISDIFISIIIGIVFGIILGGINYLLMKGSNPVVPTNVFKALIVSLNPAVFEEIACRCVFFAFCLSMADGEIKGKIQEIAGWCMMIIPHILVHLLFGLPTGILESALSWLISLVLYIGVFGIVFALLQKKRDVTSAIIAHGTVDWIRFCIFGLPF